MQFEITLGWSLVPIAVTVASILWAIPKRAYERGCGGMYGDIGYALGSAFRLCFAIIFSLVVWLAWALLT